MTNDRSRRLHGRDGDRRSGGRLPRIDLRSSIPLGEYIFYGFAVLIGVAWFAEFVAVIVVHGDTPSKTFTVLSGMVGAVMSGLIAIPRAFRRSTKDDAGA